MVLSAEAKIHMSLDDIIKLDRPMAGVSARLTPTFRRRFQSQQWRLGRNGPGTPRCRAWWRPQPLSAFLARKLSNAHPHSVFHRLGWTTRGVANYKLRQAKHHLYNRGRKFRPHRSGFWGRRPFPFVGPQRAEALFNRILATRQNFSGLRKTSNQSEANITNKPGPLTLNRQTLEALTTALGGPITVKEDISPQGSVITTITKRSALSVHSRHSNYSSKSNLNTRLQQAIAQHQGRHDELPMDGSYDPHGPKGVGIADCTLLIHATEISINERLSTPAASAMEVDS